MLILIISTLLVTVCCAFKCYLSWNFNYWSQRGVKDIKPHLLNGSLVKTKQGQCNLIEELHEIYLCVFTKKKKIQIKNLFHSLNRSHKATQKYVGIYTARQPKLFILDPQLAMQILTENFNSFRNNESSLWVRTLKYRLVVNKS